MNSEKLNSSTSQLRRPRKAASTWQSNSGWYLCFGVFLGGLFSAGAVLAADWPQFLGPNRDGVSPETGLVQTWPAQGPPLVWDKKVGEGFSGPVVAGQRLVLFHRVDGNEVVQCLDASSGKEHWKYEYPTGYRDDYGKGDGPRSTPLIAGERVYTLGAEGRLTCLELDTGKKVWDRPLNTEYRVRKGFFGVGTSPLLEGGMVLVNVGGSQAGIVAFDKDTGKEVWKTGRQDASYSSPVVATVGGKRQALFLTRAGIVSLNPANGEVLFGKPWRSRSPDSANAAAPVVADDYVFFSASYRTGAILLHWANDGFEEVWKSDESLSSHYNTSVYRDGYLYGIDGRQEAGARLRCVEFKTGKVLWTQRGFGCATLVLAEGNLIALTEQGDLVLVEATPEAYREKARAHVLEFPCRAPTALANGRFYGRDDHKLVCWNLKK
jgi:outer membrane protein assembly factor BamB